MREWNTNNDLFSNESSEESRQLLTSLTSDLNQVCNQKQTSDFLDDKNWFDTKSKILKWSLLLIGIMCVALPFLPFLALPVWAAGAIVAGGLGSAYLGQILTSNDKIKTMSKGISLVISLMTAAMIFAILPLGPISIGLALFSFIANKTLYDGDVTTLIKSFKHFFTRKITWRQRLYGIISNIISLTAATCLAYIFTMSMFVGAAHLIAGLGLAATFVAAPYIVIPVMAFCFLSNLAFAKRGIDKIFKIASELIDCFRNDQKFDGNTYKKGWVATLKYLLNINPEDTASNKAWKVFKAIILLGAASAAISFISQTALVSTLASKVGGFAFSGALQTVTQWVVSTTAVLTASKVARVALVIPKLTTALPKIASSIWAVLKRPFKKSTSESETPLIVKQQNDSLDNIKAIKNNRHYFSENKIQAFKDSINDKVESIIANNTRITDQEKKQLRQYAKSRTNDTLFKTLGGDKNGNITTFKEDVNKYAFKRMYYTLAWMSNRASEYIEPLAIVVNAACNFFFGTDPLSKSLNATTSLSINAVGFFNQQNDSKIETSKINSNMTPPNSPSPTSVCDFNNPQTF